MVILHLIRYLLRFARTRRPGATRRIVFVRDERVQYFFKELPIEATDRRCASGATCSHSRGDCALEGDEVIDQNADRMADSVMNECSVPVSPAGLRNQSRSDTGCRRRGSERDRRRRSKYCAL